MKDIKREIMENPDAYNILVKVFTQQKITKEEYMELARAFSRIYSLSISHINEPFEIDAMLINSLLLTARDLCKTPIPEYDIFDVMKYFTAE